MRKKLKEQNWESIMEEESNASQTWKRDIKDKVITVLSDLILLAHKLPNDKQEEIFTIQGVEKLISALLFPREKDFDYDQFDVRRTNIAALLVEKGLTKCISQYSKIIQPRQELNEDLITGLQKSSRICNVIALELQTQQLKLEQLQSKSNNLSYLFNWNKIQENFDNRFKQYLKADFNATWIEQSIINKSQDDKTISIIPKEDNNNSHSISITLADRKNKAILSVYGDYGHKRIKHLIVKNTNGNSIVYVKKKRPDTYNTTPAVFQ
jgi:hypothetical protein